ncbi:hypothetical protein [Pisciglobus halotolerans]|uniref:Uncharacterized protein n=1 Tax=Pisciglobus halotolerans TaxID=745365 RepID=A0A1I3C3T0_9LACT|nr:hypothetical protein [Pisciglobus halotolerans]SFH68849.1 hypothetical protein SAMN04489868_11259 [Pisciglobus halotolerans]
MFEILEEKIVNTRKEHKCYLTGEVIQKGRTAIFIRGIQDGDFYTLYILPEAEIFKDLHKKELINTEGFLEEFCIRDNMKEEWESFKKKEESE